MAICDKLFRVLAVDRFAFALAIGAYRATGLRAFIRHQAAPPEAVHDVCFRTGHESGLIGVFDAEDEVTAVLAGEEIIIEDSTYATQVESARGTGREADPDFFGIHVAKIGKKGKGMGA